VSETEARAALEQCMSIEPDVSGRIGRLWFYVNKEELDQLHAALRRVGLKD